MLTNKERNKVRKYMINRYSFDDEHLKELYPKLKTKKERAVACMESDGRGISSIDNASCGRNLYREGSHLVNSNLGCFHWYDPKVYDLIKKVYGKKKADECFEKGTVRDTYEKLIAREYVGMINDLHSGKDVMLKTSTSKPKKVPAKKKTSRWR